MKVVNMRKFWEKEEIDLLKKLYEDDGLSISELYPIFNKQYDRTSAAIQVKLDRFNLKHTKEQTAKIKHRLNSGKGNGMYGKQSPMKGLTKENSEIVRVKSKKISEIRLKMFEDNLLPRLTGETNPMYGVISWNNGLTKHTDDRILKGCGKISDAVNKRWLNKTDEEKTIIIKRLNDAMIQTRKPTKIEIKMLDYIESLGLRYIKNYRVGKFLVDFYLFDYNLVIECDGDYWHSNPKYYNLESLDTIQLKNFDRDKRKEELLNKENIKFVRFWEDDIKNNFDEIKNIIWEKLQKK